MNIGCNFITISPYQLNVNDVSLMDLFLQARATIPELGRLHCCRLFLHAFFLSDIATGDGLRITEEAWLRRKNVNLDRTLSWLAQGSPTQRNWLTFVKRGILARGWHLKHPLGPWLPISPDWNWFSCPTDSSLWTKHQNRWVHYEDTSQSNHHCYYSD